VKSTMNPDFLNFRGFTSRLPFLRLPVSGLVPLTSLLDPESNSDFINVTPTSASTLNLVMHDGV
jgi:hypothetical protein